MPKRGPRWRSALLAAGVAVALAGPASGAAGAADAPLPGRAPGTAVVVASFDFPESEMLAALYALALMHAGIPARLRLDLGPRELVQPALARGLVDVVPEYLGTALTSVAPAVGVAMSDAVAVRRELAGALAPRGVHVLRPAAAQNQNALVVTGATAARLRLRTLSDLGPLAPRLVLGGPPECQQRPLCLPGLRRVYGLRFAGFMPLATGWQRVDALGRGVVDAVITGSTDGHLAGGDLVPLADDRGLQPAENVVPVIHAAAAARYGPGLAGALDAVSARLTTDDLILLNRRITVAGRNVLAEARTWLERQGILPEPG